MSHRDARYRSEEISPGVAGNTRGKVTKEDIKEMSIQKCNSFEDRISYIEKNMKLLHERCGVFERENKDLV